MKPHLRPFFLIFLLVVPLLKGNAQQFTNVTSTVGVMHQYGGGEYGGGVSFVDFDKDGWDDLSFSNYEESPSFFKNSGGTFQELTPFFSSTSNMKNLIWVDYDNDGDRDICTQQLWGPMKLYRNEGTMVFTDVTESAGFPVSYSDMYYSSAWGDYDRDGDLDVYVSNYNGPGYAVTDRENYLYQNNGDGTFTDVTDFAGVANGYHYTFQSLWVDYDNDMWPDLLVTNDRYTCENYLYKNNRDGTFVDVSAESGIGGPVINSMNANGEDYDNDGDLDTYITNNPFGNHLYRNDGDGTYTQVEQQAGVQVFDHTWAAHFFDFDHDTWLDLHVACSPFWGQPGQNKFFKNMGDGTFDDYIVEAGFSGDIGYSHSTALGDYNNDGHYDLIVSKDAPAFSVLWKGPVFTNNWLKVRLEGVVSNRDAVGSWIDCYAGGNHYTRYTYCGEGYLSQNSFAEIFGLASYDLVDSLVVSWPSGIIDRWYDVDVNQSLLLLEGSSVTASVEIDGDTGICAGQSVELSADVTGMITWNNGIVGSSLLVSEPGTYFYTAVLDNGIEVTSNSIEITQLPVPQATITPSMVSCPGAMDGSIQMSCSTGVAEAIWNSGAYEGTQLVGLAPGNYHVDFTDLNGCPSEGDTEIAEPTPLSAESAVVDNLCHGASQGSAEVLGSGGTPPYIIDWNGVDITALAAGTFPYTVEDANGCSLTGEVTINEPDAITIELDVTDASFAFGLGSAEATVSGGTPPFEISWTSGETGASAGQLFEGTYTCYVVDANGCQASIDFNVMYNDVEESPVGNFVLFPNPGTGTLNIASSGFNTGIHEIQINDLTGKLVLKKQFQGGSVNSIDIQSLSPGIYTVLWVEDGLVKWKETFVKEID